jgi:ribosome maturation factor RimP
VGKTHSFNFDKENIKVAKKKITDLVSDFASEFLMQNGLELYHCEFVKEGKDWFLRVYIDKANGDSESYVSTDDCELVSRFLSQKLDEEDPIAQNYYLEVSSPGMDRILYKEKDFEKFKGHLVDVSLYKGIDGQKMFSGKLVGLVENQVIIIDEADKELKFPAEQVVSTRLAVVF